VGFNGISSGGPGEGGMMRVLRIQLLLLLGAIAWPSITIAQAPAVATPAQGPSSVASAVPKKRIAVLKFDAGALGTQAGDVGGGLAAQLTTALVNSGQFIVIERTELANVLREQEMSAQKLVSGETAAQVGRLLGAQLLVRGTVTEFDQQSGGGGVRLGVGGIGNTMGALGTSTTSGNVAIDVRLIDTSTGQVVQSHRAEAKVEARGYSAEVGVRNMSIGGDSFDKTPLGQATRQAVEQAVTFVIAATTSLPWTGRIVDVSGDQVFLNAGADTGLKPGDRFAVSTVVRELTDPSSGALLGVIEEALGDVQVVSVQEKFSIARMSTPFAAKRGDLVRAKGLR
jgi:curli biogenesis system outer membrane secretion channel CsgG